jgi:hypothetical protein
MRDNIKYSFAPCSIMDKIVGFTKDGQPVRVYNMALQPIETLEVNTVILGAGLLIGLGVLVWVLKKSSRRGQ